MSRRTIEAATTIGQFVPGATGFVSQAARFLPAATQAGAIFRGREPEPEPVPTARAPKIKAPAFPAPPPPPPTPAPSPPTAGEAATIIGRAARRRRRRAPTGRRATILTSPAGAAGGVTIKELLGE